MFVEANLTIVVMDTSMLSKVHAYILTVCDLSHQKFSCTKKFDKQHCIAAGSSASFANKINGLVSALIGT